MGGRGSRRLSPDEPSSACSSNGSVRPRVRSADPLEVFREGLVLARRAGMNWEQAYRPAREAALSVEPDEWHRDQWAVALHDTRTAWMRAYERRPTGCTL